MTMVAAPVTAMPGDPADSWAAAREALLIPSLLLGSALLGAVRVSATGGLSLVGPSLFGLVLGGAICLLALRSGLVRPGRLVGPQRSALANANGVMALLALLFASGQAITLLTPEAGLVALLVGAFYLALLAQIAAVRPDGPRLLRSLLVLLGGGLLLRFMLLNGLADPSDSLARHAFASLVEGLTPGGLGLEHHGTATGYTAFVSVLLYVGGLVLLPGDHSAWRLLGSEDDRPRR